MEILLTIVFVMVSAAFMLIENNPLGAIWVLLISIAFSLSAIDSNLQRWK